MSESKATVKAFWESRKFQQVNWWLLSSVTGSIIALNAGLPFEVVSSYWIGSGIAIAGAMVAYGLSDAAHAK